MRNKNRNGVVCTELEKPSPLIKNLSDKIANVLYALLFAFCYMEMEDSSFTILGIFFVLLYIYKAIKIKDNGDIKKLVESIDFLKNDIQLLRRGIDKYGR